MDLSKIMLIIGSIILAFGILFTAESQSVVGPESSFMYRNPAWTINGAIISAIGAVIIASGVVLRIKSKHRL